MKETAHRLAALVFAGAAFLITSPDLVALDLAERARIEAARIELRHLLVPDLMENEEGEWPVPRAVFFREMELILGEHVGRRPYYNTVLGERYHRLIEFEKTEGFTAFMRSQWEAFFWDWREALDQ